jgi:homoserine dehydrogenase
MKREIVMPTTNVISLPERALPAWSDGAIAAAGSAPPDTGETNLLRLDAALLASDPEVLSRVHEIYRHHRAGRRVVVAVESEDGAGALHRASAAGAAAESLCRALDRAGIPVRLLPPAPSPLPSPAAGRRDPRWGTAAAWCPVVVVPAVSASAPAGAPAAAPAARRASRPARPAVAASGRPLRVLLLGLGTVGGGVFRHLCAAPARFAVVGIAVRHAERHRRAGVPAELLDTDPWRLMERPCDAVVELLGGREPAAALIAAALERGRHVVTANKMVLAEEGGHLARQAAAAGVALLGSAAVGGAVPVVEAVARAAATGRVRAVRGVLNGTCNFVLDRLAAGCSLAAAVAEAQAAGFAEADPAQDLDGRDAACKLRVLARIAFGAELAAADVDCRGIAGLDPGAVAAARARGRTLRLVAECRRLDVRIDRQVDTSVDQKVAGRVIARVRPVSLPSRHFLAGARGEENRVIVESVAGPPLRLCGRGAGRWPTSEAVLADLLDLSTEAGS